MITRKRRPGSTGSSVSATMPRVVAAVSHRPSESARTAPVSSTACRPLAETVKQERRRKVVETGIRSRVRTMRNSGAAT